MLDRLEMLAEDTQKALDSLPSQEELENEELRDLAKLQQRLKNLHELMDANKSAVGKVYDMLRVAVIPPLMEDQGVASVTLSGIGRLQLTDDIRVKVLDKSKQYQWLEMNGNGDLITETVNASSLKALLRRQMREGEAIPGDTFEVTPFTRASIVKEK